MFFTGYVCCLEAIFCVPGGPSCPHGPVWTGIEDVLFWFGAGVWSFILVFLFQDGQLRLYMAAAAGGGMLLYRKIAGENGWRGAFPGSSVCRFGFFLFFGKKSTHLLS